MTIRLSHPQGMGHASRIGRYHLTKRIAFGGMAEVYRALVIGESGKRIEVAVKRLLPLYSEDAEFILMLQDEYRLVTHLRHPNIVAVFELSKHRDEVVIAMEFVDGKDLRSCIEKARKTQRAIRLDHAVYVLIEALKGLEHAHQACGEDGSSLHIVHRDFSPANILLSYEGRVKLCDFGIAKATTSSTTTQTGLVKGKMKYMSPEHAKGQKLDSRSDVFSAGCVLYELCTGKAAYRAKGDLALIEAIQNARIIPPKTVNPKIPARLASIIDKALAPKAEERFQSAEEFREALQNFLRDAQPNFHPNQLTRFLKRLFFDEIESDLRTLEAHALDIESGEEDESVILITSKSAGSVEDVFSVPQNESVSDYADEDTKDIPEDATRIQRLGFDGDV